MIGIVILNYNTYKETINCANSVISTCGGQYKIYIVDNASQDESYSKLSSYFGKNNDVLIISSTINLGYAAGNNVGIKQALADGCNCIIISNSDVIFHEESINKMYDFLRLNKNVGIVGPKELNRMGEIEKKSRIFIHTGIKEKLFARTKLRMFNFGNIYNKYYGIDKPFNEITEVYAVGGACFAISRKMAESITPLDDNTFLYEEEMIIGIRAAKTGLKTVYLPTARVTHYHAASSKYIGAYSLIHLVKSEIYYCKTYLKAPILKILPLYFIRVLLYLSRCVSDRSYRSNLKNFIIETQDRLWSKNGLGVKKKDL